VDARAAEAVVEAAERLLERWTYRNEVALQEAVRRYRATEPPA